MDRGSDTAGGVSGVDALKELPQSKVIELAMMSLVASAEPDRMMDLAYAGALLVQASREIDECVFSEISSQPSASPSLKESLEKLMLAMLDVYAAAFDMVKEEFIEV